MVLPGKSISFVWSVCFVIWLHTTVVFLKLQAGIMDGTCGQVRQAWDINVQLEFMPDKVRKAQVRRAAMQGCILAPDGGRGLAKDLHTADLTQTLFFGWEGVTLRGREVVLNVAADGTCGHVPWRWGIGILRGG